LAKLGGERGVRDSPNYLFEKKENRKKKKNEEH
jgi:hypothetical protein